MKKGVKTDRRDAAKLVRPFRARELSAIHMPAEAEEAGWDLIRCRDTSAEMCSAGGPAC